MGRFKFSVLDLAWEVVFLKYFLLHIASWTWYSVSKSMLGFIAIHGENYIICFESTVWPGTMPKRCLSLNGKNRKTKRCKLSNVSYLRLNWCVPGNPRIVVQIESDKIGSTGHVSHIVNSTGSIHTQLLRFRYVLVAVYQYQELGVRLSFTSRHMIWTIWERCIRLLTVELMFDLVGV